MNPVARFSSMNLCRAAVPVQGIDRAEGGDVPYQVIFRSYGDGREFTA